MRRSPLIAFCALLFAALTLVPVALAHDGHDHQGPAGSASTPKTCVAASPEVVGGSVSGKLTSSDVDPVQARFATCGWARKVMKRATELGVEEPRPVRGFFCRPTVNAYDPSTVSYICTFRGADTATFIKLAFRVTYRA
jgi:hypothetical protein